MLVLAEAAEIRLAQDNLVRFEERLTPQKRALDSAATSRTVYRSVGIILAVASTQVQRHRRR